LQFGVTQVPFGDLTWASHSYWFSTAYYAGLEDDYDMGLKYSYTSDKFDLDVAYFHMPEPSGPSYGNASWGMGGAGRYSYDVLPVDNFTVYERNQANVRGAVKLGDGENTSTEIGLSAQIGMLKNDAIDENGSHFAGALHVDADLGNFNIKAHGIYFNHTVKDDSSNTADVVYMGAYGDAYAVAAEAVMLTAGVAYRLDIDAGPVNSLTFYDDFTYTLKTNEDFEPTLQNTVGIMVAAGPIYTYIDLASGQNHPWLTDSFGTGLGAGITDAPWNHRVNVNVGYYF
jgi:hypothetical protein